MRCSYGTLPAPLTIPPRGTSTSRTQALATVADSVPLVNVPPFGGCLSPTHPAAGGGVPPPCMPQPNGPWSGTGLGTRVSGAPALTADATLTCTHGGVITVSHAGQRAITMPNG